MIIKDNLEWVEILDALQLNMSHDKVVTQVKVSYEAHALYGIVAPLDVMNHLIIMGLIIMLAVMLSVIIRL